MRKNPTVTDNRRRYEEEATEGIVAGVEQWLCNHRSDKVVSGHIAMT